MQSGLLLDIVVGEGPASQGLDEDLHSTSETEDQMQSGLLLDVVVGEGPAILQLLASKDQPLLIWRNSFLVLDLGLDIFNGVRRLHLKGDGLAGEGLNEDLHLSSTIRSTTKWGQFSSILIRSFLESF